MTNKIKYIIDHKGYGDIFDLTNTRTGEHNEITRAQAKDYRRDYYAYFTFRADVQVRSVSQFEIIPGTTDALNKLSVRA
jgi:hypothetical protein